VTGRQKSDIAALEAVITGHWFAEYMARQKTLKSPSHYIAMTRPKKHQTGQDVLAIFKGFEASGVPMNIKKLR